MGADRTSSVSTPSFVRALTIAHTSRRAADKRQRLLPGLAPPRRSHRISVASACASSLACAMRSAALS